MEVLLNSFHFNGKDLKVRASDNRTGAWYLVPCIVNDKQYHMEVLLKNVIGLHCECQEVI